MFIILTQIINKYDQLSNIIQIYIHYIMNQYMTFK
jgi:hypothetical protein